MKLQTGHHLVYCFNCFSYQTIDELDLILGRFVSKLRTHLSLNFEEPIGVGLHFSNVLISQINVIELKLILEKHNLYVPTLNAFPYHYFHEEVVKTRVYLPHWGEAERMEYTLKNLILLSSLLPDGVDGVVSTLPFGYKDAPLEEMGTGLKQIEQMLHFIQMQSGKKITLAFEPEPDCLIESVRGLPKMADCFSCCFDTSHAEIVRDKLHCEMPITKIQLSAALEIDPTCYNHQIPSVFLDPKYLHQTRIGNKRYADLERTFEGDESLVSHFHLPIYLDEIQDGVRTKKDVLKQVIESVKKGEISQNTILEIETYTWSILHKQLSVDLIEDGMIKEYDYILQQLKK